MSSAEYAESKSRTQQEKDQDILRSVKNIRYGTVQIIIHDSEVVQIECTEKIRFENGKSK